MIAKAFAVVLLASSTFLPAGPVAQGDSKAAPKLSASSFREPVDGLVRAFRHAANPDGSLVADQTRETAMVLCAAGHCHRFYNADDGPWARRAILYLFKHRGKDGGFESTDGADPVTTTRWAVDALEVMHPQRYATDVANAREWLKKKGAPTTSVFQELMASLAAKADPLAYGQEQAAKVPTPVGRPAPAAAVILTELVALQVLGRNGGVPPAPVSPAPRGDVAPAREFSAAQQKGVDFLLKQQKDGVIEMKTRAGAFPSVEFTSLGLAAMQTKPKDKRSDTERVAIEKGLAWLLAGQNKDGSFGQTTVNYTTSSVILALKMSGDPNVTGALERAQKYLLGIQHTEARDFAKEDRDYGSIGYGGSERGDLSNLQFALQALRDTGLPADHEAFQKALVFLQRTQNLKEVNDYHPGLTRNPDQGGAWEKMGVGDDGGAAYYPGNSPAGYVELADGTKVPRSYGSMTYALLKAYTLCGVDAKDPRVKAAVDWIGRNWSLEENPGSDPKLGDKNRYQGLYYYYMVMAQALDVAGLREVQTAAGEKVDWRKALRAHLEKSQREDGSWLNEKNERWWENLPVLCTIYALLALQKC